MPALRATAQLFEHMLGVLEMVKDTVASLSSLGFDDYARTVLAIADDLRDAAELVGATCLSNMEQGIDI